MRTFATALALGLGALVAPAVQAQTVTSQIIQTGTVSNTIYNNGNIGGDCDGGTLAFFFNGDEPLCGAGFLLGLSATNVIGDAYILTAATGWTPVSLGASTDFPYAAAGYSAGYKAVFTNATNGFSVEMNAYYASTTNPDAIIYRYDITNTGTTARTNVYPGLFWDWDIGGADPSAENTAAVDLANNLLYVQDPTLTSGTVGGAAALSADLSGWKYNVAYPSAAGQPQSRSELWTGLTTTSTATSAARDQRGTIGTGPFTIPAGGTLTSVFTLGAGTSLADLQANITAAQLAVPVAGEAAPEAAGYAIRSAQPNPVRTTGAISYTIPTDGTVRVTMYDALGRAVATLHDGAQAAGDHTVQMDASALAPGVYVVRVEAGGRQMTQRVSVVR